MIHLQKIISQFKNRNSEVSLWKNILDRDIHFWKKAQSDTKKGKKILLATSLGGYNQGAVLESILAVALTLRGAQVEILLCDEFLPACQLTKIQKISPEELTKEGQLRLCKTCFRSGMHLFSDLSLPIRRYSSFISSGKKTEVEKISSSISLDEISEYKFHGYSVGEHAKAGCLRYYAKGDLQSEKLGSEVLRKYLKSAILTSLVIENLLKQYSYQAVCFHHGIYVPQGLIGEVCRKKNIRVINWNPAYRKHSFIFSHSDSYHHTMISEPVSVWKNLKWSGARENETMTYLKSRWEGKNDWIWFNKEPKFGLDDIAKEKNINFSKPCIGMLTNVMWDAQLHYPSNAFQNMFDWVVKTITYFKKRTDLQLIIRVHPAEITGAIPSRQPLVNEIQKVFPSLPKNIFIIPPESHISTYAVMQKCNAVIIYNTKTGIELSSIGLPVIVAGEAWIRGKGFSYDATTEDEYYRILNKLPLKKGLTAAQLLKAKKYAYHFFFRRMIPLPFITNLKQFEFGVSVNKISELKKGKFKGLDVICDGILHAKSFIYPAEKIN